MLALFEVCDFLNLKAFRCSRNGGSLGIRKTYLGCGQLLAASGTIDKQ